MRSTSAKIVLLAHAVADVRAWRAAGETVVFANGVFDLVHVGHVRYLSGARVQGSRLVVGINSDRSAAELKGPGRPVLGERERALLIAALRVVDRVVIFAERSAVAILEALAPDVHAQGTDYRPATAPERATMSGLGGRTVVAGDPESHASRELYERVRARQADRE